MNFKYLRGEVYWANLKGYDMSSCQRGTRPVVIVSSLAGSLSSDLVLVCPLTTKLKDLTVNINVGKLPGSDRESQVMTSQITTVPKSILGDYITSFDLITMDKVNTGILISIGLAKPVVSKLQATQEALAEAKKDREAMENLLPKAKQLLEELGSLYNKITNANIKITSADKNSGRVKRSPEVIRDFIRDWEDKYNDRNEVASAYGFKNYSSAYNFYTYHKNKKETK